MESCKPRRRHGRHRPIGPVNINTASAAELDALPGIGAKTAALIVEYRQKNGPFKKVEELMNVRGVGEKNFLKLRTHISVGGPKADHATAIREVEEDPVSGEEAPWPR